MEKKRVLFLYETSVGLGHQRRTSGIANGMARAGLNVVVASGTFVHPEDFFDPSIQLVKLPASRRHKEDGKIYYYDEQNRTIEDPGFDPQKWSAERLAAIAPIAAVEQIDAILVEWWPFQRRREFTKMVHAIVSAQMKHFGHKPMVVSSIRDVLTKFKNPEGEQAQTVEMAAVELINKHVDHLFVHADPHLITLSETFSRADLVEKPIHYTGYVVHDGIEPRPFDQRQQTVLVSCGSGDHGHHLMKAAAKARMHSALRDFKWIYVLGPRMEEPHRDDFASVLGGFNGHAAALPTEIHTYVDDLPIQMGQVGLSLSYAGYNSTLEVTRSRAPALLVPKMARKDELTHPEDFDSFDKEQWRRLLRLQERGMASIAHPDDTRDTMVFARAIDAAYIKGIPDGSLNMDGARETASILSGLLTVRSSAETMPTSCVA